MATAPKPKSIIAKVPGSGAGVRTKASIKFVIDSVRAQEYPACIYHPGRQQRIEIQDLPVDPCGSAKTDA
jgi:hypothetical protein